MAVIDLMKCGRVIIFDSMMFKSRWAFCIDNSLYDQIVYRGFFGLRTIDKKCFLGFARIVDIFDCMDRDLKGTEIDALKAAHRTGIMKSCVDVQEYIDKLFKAAGIKIFISPEGWHHEDIAKR